MRMYASVLQGDLKNLVKVKAHNSKSIKRRKMK